MKQFLRGSRRTRLSIGILTLALASTLGVTEAPAQSPTPPTSIQTFHLTNILQQNDANEILVALRNMLDPRVKIYLVASHNDILIEAAPEQLQMAEHVIHELDRPHLTYRLTYTLTEWDGSKQLDTHHFSLVAIGGQRATLKEGMKVPIFLGSHDTTASTPDSQFTYLDVGINLDSTVVEYDGGISLRSKVEESSAGEEHSAISAQDPVIHQVVLENTSAFAIGKSQTIGTLDVPGSTRHLQVEADVEAIK